MSHCHLDVPPLNNVLPMFLQLGQLIELSREQGWLWSESLSAANLHMLFHT